MKAATFTITGKKLEPTILPKEWKEDKNLNLVSQAVHVYEDRLHKGHRKAQTRAEVNRTKKKLFKQKGTGNARHGSRSAPIFVGGGVAHGPRPIKKVLYLSSKMKRKSLLASLALKSKNSESIVVKDLEKIKKTKEAQKFLDAAKITNRRTFVLKEGSVRKVLKNLENTNIKLFSDLNTYDVLFGGTLIFDSAVFEKPKKETKKVTKTTKKEK
ncbi:50S ribosomal protein L4 [Candidatus Woesebacteria bacterium]|nr:50S ribosomal protein L4 [Candidatus Woesebacteria bacterium]QQG47782.1 MAG: 50S ribosomal protein L4 [Candidatus Woesebacteria bacterium]